MINCSYFNVFDRSYEGFSPADKQMKKVKNLISSAFYEETNSPHSMKKQKVSKVSYRTPVIAGVALVMSAVFTFFYLKNAPGTGF